MSDETKNCPCCSGRGYHRCPCWPGDCICGSDDEECDVCYGDGVLDQHEFDDLFETQPIIRMSQKA